MSSTMLRSQALRQIRAPLARRSINPSARRTYAEQVDHSRSTDPNPPTRNNLPLIGVGCLMAAVPFYYFYHSNRSPSAGQKDMAERRKNGDGPGSEYRDVRDSPIKTLEDKQRKEAGQRPKREG